MKKYNTRPIDFTGCHPVIAEALKRGEAIECEVWDFREKPPADGCGVVWIGSYHHGASHPYTDTNDTLWKHAEPIPIKVKRIMPPERAIPVLIAEGWKFSEHGHLICSREKKNVFAIMLCLMGKSLDDPKVSSWEWPSCIIEEVEDDE